jgi:hypothetical protein
MAALTLAAGISAGLGLAGSGMSILESINAKRTQRESERAADQALSRAKKELSVNRLEGVQVPIEAYTQAMRAVTAQQMQTVEGLRESGQRALAAGLGRAQAVSGDIVEKQRLQMDKALADRELLIAQEDARIDQSLANISLGEATGAMAASQQNQQIAAMQMSSAASGLGAVGENIYEAMALYQKGKKDKKDKKDKKNILPPTAESFDSGFGDTTPQWYQKESIEKLGEI